MIRTKLLLWSFSWALILLLGSTCKKQQRPSKPHKPSPAATPRRAPPRRAGPLAQTLRPLHQLKGHELGVEDLVFSPDSKWLVSGSEDDSVRVWDLATGKTKRTFEGHEKWVAAVAFHPQDQLVASGSGDRTLRICRVNRKTKARIIKEHAGVRSVAFSPDGVLLASGAFGGDIRLWHVASGDWRRTLKGHTSDVYTVAFSPDGKLLASGGADRKIHLWRVSTGKSKQVLEGHTDRVRLVAFTADGKQLVSVAGDRSIRTWDVTTGKLLSTVTLAQDTAGGAVRAAALSPDGGLLLAAVGKTALLAKVASGRVQRRFPASPKPIFTVAFSPDGHAVAWSGADAIVHVWSAK